MFFSYQEYSRSDKDIYITGPDENVWLTLDYDDVNRDIVELYLERIVQVLNDHWEDYPRIEYNYEDYED